MKKIILFLMMFSLIIIYAPCDVLAKDEYTIFTSTTCGYCAQVKSATEEQKYDEKLNIIFKDIDTSDENLNQYLIAKDACGYDISESDYSVPMSYDGEDCIFGSVKILEDIAERTNTEPVVQIYEPQDTASSSTTDDEEQTEQKVSETVLIEPQENKFGIREILFISIPPVILIAIAYLLIFKMRL
jgi:hypothetical protein